MLITLIVIIINSFPFERPIFTSASISWTTRSESRLCLCFVFVLPCLCSFLSALLWRQVSTHPVSATFPRHPAHWDQYSVNVLNELISCVHSPSLFSFACLSRETWCWVCLLFTTFSPSWLPWIPRSFLHICIYSYILFYFLNGSSSICICLMFSSPILFWLE